MTVLQLDKQNQQKTKKQTQKEGEKCVNLSHDVNWDFLEKQIMPESFLARSEGFDMDRVNPQVMN